MPRSNHRYAGIRPHKLTKNEVVDRIMRNGITQKDLEYSYNEGREKGFSDGVAAGMDSVYACILIALHREFGFGKERLTRLVHTVTQIQIEEISSYDALQTLAAETGVPLPMLSELKKEVV